ncbi:hypothetical protein ABW20_dc0109351 [Dactylellina cionopaga]|nr:hypothetical protein ABW20_dc0109351 [Dactylellina cionopaga]
MAVALLSQPIISSELTLNILLVSFQEHYKSLVAAFKAEPHPRQNNGEEEEELVNTTRPSIETAIFQSETAEEYSGISIGKFRNCRQHSIGGASTIFRSRHPATHETVALKVTSSWVQPHDAYREARLLKRLAGHDTHILTLLETDTLRGEFILVFPFYPLTLADLMEKGKPKHLPQIFRQVAKGLSFVHANGVIHRDMKPANILLKSEEGPACLCDFGTAWAHDDHHPDENFDSKVIEIGTTCYRSPETLFGYRAYNTEVDIWAFGCVIAEAENRSPLFEAGELGTDLRLVLSIFQSLGTPNLEIWPEAKDFPDFGKMLFNEFTAQPWESILPNVSPNIVDLVQNMVTYSQRQRFSAEQVLKHPYLT